MQELIAILARASDVFAKGVNDFLGGFEAPQAHYDAIRYHLGVGKSGRQPAGKRLRPALLLEIARAFGAREAWCERGAVAIELLHAASLVHDDVQDGDRLRWGRPTVWLKFGKNEAINIGDALIGLTYEAALSLREVGVDLSRVLEIQSLLASTHRMLVEGQHLDMAFERRREVSLAEYFGMIRLKTASVCACSTQVGALLGKPSIREEARIFGLAYGTLLQILDDMRGIWSSTAETGKEELKDLRLRKKSLPIVLAQSTGSPGFARLFDGGSAISFDEAQGLRAKMDSFGIYDQCTEFAKREYMRALATLDSLNSPGLGMILDKLYELLPGPASHSSPTSRVVELSAAGDGRSGVLAPSRVDL